MTKSSNYFLLGMALIMISTNLLTCHAWEEKMKKSMQNYLNVKRDQLSGRKKEVCGDAAYIVDFNDKGGRGKGVCFNKKGKKNK